MFPPPGRANHRRILPVHSRLKGKFCGCNFAEFVFVQSYRVRKGAKPALFRGTLRQCQIHPSAQRSGPAFGDGLICDFDQFGINGHGQAFFAHTCMLTKVIHLSYTGKWGFVA